MKPQLGRTFARDDFQRQDTRIAVLSHSLWQTRYAGDPAIVGKTVAVDNAGYRVLGVMPAGFYPTRWETPKLWIPLYMDPAQSQSRVGWKLFTFARLKPGVTFDAAQREMDVISDRLTAAFPEHYDNMCVGADTGDRLSVQPV